MSAEKKRQMGVMGLVIALVVVLMGSVLFVGATAGWFDDPKVVLGAEYDCEEDCEFVELTAEGYEDLIERKASFVVMIDQGGCTTADRLREYALRYAEETGKRMYRMMFADVKETTLHEVVKYYPSMAIISQGKVVGYLRADSDEDAEVYNNYEEFRGWMERWVR